jgi:hypothetical protein
MKTLPALFAVVGLLLCSCGGKVDSYEEAMDAHLQIMDDMVSVLEGVTDQASAKAAQEDLAAIGQRARDLADQTKGLPQPDEAERKRMMDKGEARAQELQQQMMKQMMKLAQYPELQKAVSDAMSQMP